MRTVLSILLPAICALVSASTANASTPDVTVSDKKPSSDISAAVAVSLGEVVKGRLGVSSDTGNYHYWLVDLPAGSYKIVVDVRRTDDQDSNIGGDLDWYSVDGERITDAGHMNSIAYRDRWVFGFTSKQAQKAVLRYECTFAMADYWLGIFRSTDKVASPFFISAPTVHELTLGESATAMALDSNVAQQRYAYHSATLPAGDYRVSVAFARSDKTKSNVGGRVAVLGSHGDTQESSLLYVNEIDFSARRSSKLSLAEEASIIFRIAAEFGRMDATFKIETWADR